MNQQLQAYARQTLKDGLARCTDAQRRIFRLMYSHKNPDLDINSVVDAMPPEKLDWAMRQVERTLKTFEVKHD